MGIEEDTLITIKDFFHYCLRSKYNSIIVSVYKMMNTKTKL